MRHETIIGTWFDPFGRNVTLTMQQWVEHILKFHPVMAVRLEDVGKTVEKPEFIFNDGDEDLYYRKIVSEHGIRYYKIVIRKNKDGSGNYRVVTSFRARKMQDKGVVIWQKE